MSWLSKLSGSKSSPAVAAASKVARPSGPPHIIVDHKDYQPDEFALGSFRIRPYDGDLIAKQQFDFRIAFKLGANDVELICRGVVIKLDDQAGLVARYQRPQPFQEAKLIEYMKLWKGL